MKTNRIKLVEFMAGKAREIHRITEIDPEKYFCKGDFRSMLSWSDRRSKRIWRKIKKNVLKSTNEDSIGIGSRACPFCIYHKGRCLPCTYGYNHEICDFPHSDFKRIRAAMFIAEKPLTREFYINLIGEIEDEN